jgi:hypothetical protein
MSQRVSASRKTVAIDTIFNSPWFIISLCIVVGLLVYITFNNMFASPSEKTNNPATPIPAVNVPITLNVQDRQRLLNDNAHLCLVTYTEMKPTTPPPVPLRLFSTKGITGGTQPYLVNYYKALFIEKFKEYNTVDNKKDSEETKSFKNITMSFYTACFLVLSHKQQTARDPITETTAMRRTQKTVTLNFLFLLFQSWVSMSMTRFEIASVERHVDTLRRHFVSMVRFLLPTTATMDLFTGIKNSEITNGSFYNGGNWKILVKVPTLNKKYAVPQSVNVYFENGAILDNYLTYYDLERIKDGDVVQKMWMLDDIPTTQKTYSPKWADKVDGLIITTEGYTSIYRTETIYDDDHHSMRHRYPSDMKGESDEDEPQDMVHHDITYHAPLVYEHEMNTHGVHENYYV